MDEHSAALFLSAVTVAEIEDGIAKLRREGATRKSEDLKDWFETVLHLYGDRVLAFDTPVARIAGGTTLTIAELIGPVEANRSSSAATMAVQ